MAREPSSILDKRIQGKTSSIYRKINNRNYGQFERAYLYVALATCLEADVKYRTRFALDISGGSADLFKVLYGESRLDLDILFHVIDESISLSDLVSEATNVSDVRGLLSKCETLLNALSGTKIGLLERFKKVANKEKDPSAKEALDLAVSRFDKIVSDIDLVFQIRHAVVHDVFVSGGPIGWAVRRKKLLDVYTSCVGFLLILDDAYFDALWSGPYLTAPRRARNNKLYSKLRREVVAIEKRLIKRHPIARKKIDKLDTGIGALISHISGVLTALAGKQKSDDNETIWSPDLASTLFRFSSKVFNLLERSSLESERVRQEQARKRPR
jgi:hypothetical protein